MKKNTELSTSESAASKMTENSDENVDTEEEMDFDDLIIPGDYSDYDFWRKKKKLYPKMIKFGSKLKKRYRGVEYC